MKLILGIDAIKPPLTGIGRYAWELASGIPAQPGVESLRYFGHGGFVSDVAALMRQAPAKLAARRTLLRNRLAVGAYRRVAPLFHRMKLGALDDHLFHGPNFYLPDFPGRSVATIHDLSIFRYPEFHPPERVAFMRKEIPLTLRRADLLITDSEYIRREVIEMFSWPEERIVAIPLAAHHAYHPRVAADTAAVLARHGLTHDRYALCVSTIEPRKNIGALIRAYGSLPEAVRGQYPLVLAGDRGWLSHAIHRQMELGAVQGWLRYLGYVPEHELPSLFAGARGFALPSLYEGFGLPVLEAMASGVPVLTSRASALSELAGDAALLVAPLDEGSIAQGLRALLEDERWRGIAIARSLAVARDHSWEITVRRTLAAYRACREQG